MIDSLYIALIPLLPLFSFLIIGIFGRRYFPSLCGAFGNLSLLTSFILSCAVAYNYFVKVGFSVDHYEKLVPLKLTWLQFSETLSIDMGIILDPISVMMLLIVTFISLMVHVYSLGYMHDDPRKPTYFAFLSLFTFSMLGLVMSSNLFQIYIFWELVGVSSFLLIGFYFNKQSAVAAAKKAFIVTRFADFGFLIGILITSYQTNTLDFATLIERATQPSFISEASGISFLGISALTWGLVFIFIGGAGKSAMFPLHIWLPDAMEGPTPVSALIHAATMVVAGVYLVARLFPVFAISCPIALDIVAYIGIISSVFAAIIACTQTDIKRILAFSTMSQIGFMMFALGVSGYEGENGAGYLGSMFHLFTHAIFKALLFLGAGAVIHYVHSNEMKDMGGLRKLMPITHIVFLIACLAIAGIPPFAGFFSKEEILLAAWHSNKMIFILAVFTSTLTAFYMFRLYFSIFWNKPFVSHNKNHHSEASISMKLPLLILGGLTICCGFIPFGNFVSADGKILPTELHILFSIAPVALAIAGIFAAMLMYKKQNHMPDKVSNGLSGLYSTIYHKFYFDEIYLFITKKVIFNLIGKPAAWIDRNIVDGCINGCTRITMIISNEIKGVQSGKLQDYALYFLLGVIGFVMIIVYLQN